MKQKTKFLFSSACVLLAVLYVWHALAVYYVVDDGFISFRYAKNLMEGHGLVFNPGERVEGYTNFLWVILLAGSQWLLPGVSMLYIAQTLGLLFGVLTILLICRFSWLIRKEFRFFGLLAGAFLAVHSGFTAWATSGLETTMYAFLVFAGAYAYVTYLRTGKYFLVTPIVFALAALTRPDGIVFFSLTTAFALYIEIQRGQKLIWQRMSMWILVFVAIYGPYYAWRFAYYGYPLPNTFYVKVGQGINQYLRGVRYLRRYLEIYGVFVFMPSVLLLLRRKQEVWLNYFILLVGGYAIYLIYVGGDGLAFFRFLTYIAPLIYLLVQESFFELYKWLVQLPFLSKFASPLDWKLAVPMGLLVAFSLAFTARHSGMPLLFPERYRWYEPQSELHFPGLERDHVYVWFDNYFVDRLAVAAHWLEANAPPDAVVASTPAGSIAYHMDLQVIDMLGLNDVHIAHTEMAKPGKGRAGHEKGDGKYILSRSPDYILMGNVAVLPWPVNKELMEQKLVQKSEQELWTEPDFHNNYDLVCVHLAQTGLFQYFTFFKKKDPALSSSGLGTPEEACGQPS